MMTLSLDATYLKMTAALKRCTVITPNTSVVRLNPNQQTSTVANTMKVILLKILFVREMLYSIVIARVTKPSAKTLSSLSMTWM